MSFGPGGRTDTVVLRHEPAERFIIFELHSIKDEQKVKNFIRAPELITTVAIFNLFIFLLRDRRRSRISYKQFSYYISHIQIFLSIKENYNHKT